MGSCPPNGCMIVHNINNIIVSEEATLAAENSGKPLSGRASAPNSARGAHRAPAGPLAGGEGLLPPPKNLIPVLGLRPFGLGPQ